MKTIISDFNNMNEPASLCLEADDALRHNSWTDKNSS